MFGGLVFSGHGVVAGLANSVIGLSVTLNDLE